MVASHPVTTEVAGSLLGTGNVTYFLLTRMLLQHLDGKHRGRMHSSPDGEREREVCALKASTCCSLRLRHPHSGFLSGKDFPVLCKSEEGLPPGQSSTTSLSMVSCPRWGSSHSLLRWIQGFFRLSEKVAMSALHMTAFPAFSTDVGTQEVLRTVCCHLRDVDMCNQLPES